MERRELAVSNVSIVTLDERKVVRKSLEFLGREYGDSSCARPLSSCEFAIADNSVVLLSH